MAQLTLLEELQHRILVLTGIKEGNTPFASRHPILHKEPRWNLEDA